MRPSPKVGLQGDWKPVDELHAVLVHCDTWTPRFSGLRGNVVPLGPVQSGTDHRAARHFQEGVITYSELLILEKPPEMSKKKRKKPEDETNADGTVSSAPAQATPHYRMMFSLYRRDANPQPPQPPPADGEPAPDPQPDGKHLTFCMAPEDILIRNSFHMLSENEKEARRNEYKSKQLTPKIRTSNGAGSSSNGAAQAAAQAAAAALAISSHNGGLLAAASAIDVDGTDYASPSSSMLPVVSTTAMLHAGGVQQASALPQLTIEALKSHAANDSAAHERIVKLEGISPGMCGGAMALLPDAPLLSALSTTSGSHAGGTSVWIQGSRFNTRTRVYVAGQVAARVTVVSDGLVTIATPQGQPGVGTVEVRATNDGCAWSNALHYTYTTDGLAEGASVESSIMQRQLSLLQQLVQACCGSAAASEQMVSDLMTPALAEPQRLFGAVLALLLAGSAGNGAALDLGRQDAHGCTLMHYVCALRNLPALQLLLNASINPALADSAGNTAAEWARRFQFADGEAAIARATGVPLPAGAAAATATATSVPIEGVAASSSSCVPGVATTTGGTPPLVSAPFGGAAPGGDAHPMRSLDQFIDPSQGSAEAQQSGDAQRSLAGFLTAAAAHVETRPTG